MQENNKGLWLLIIVAFVLLFGSKVDGPVDSNAPFKTDKLSVLILEETEVRVSLPLSQLAVLDASDDSSVRAWVANHQGEFRLLDVSQDPTRDSQWVQDAYKAAKEAKEFKTPWVVAANERSGVNQALPLDTEATKTLLKPLGKGN